MGHELVRLVGVEAGPAGEDLEHHGVVPDVGLVSTGAVEPSRATLSPMRTAIDEHDFAWDAPLYSLAEAGRIIRQSPSTLNKWATGYPYPTLHSGIRQQQPLITRSPAVAGKVLPFAGIAEAFVLTRLKEAGVPMRRIRPAVEELKREMGSIEHVLLSERLKTDGARVIFEYLVDDNPRFAPVETLATVSGTPDRQIMFREALVDQLESITYSSGMLDRITLPFYGVPVTISPLVNAGRPTILGRGIRVDMIVDRGRAGEPVVDLAEDFGLPVEDVARLLADAI